MDTELHHSGKLKSAYNALVSKGQIEPDPAQIELITKLDKLLVQVSTKRLSNKSSSLGWLFGKKADAENAVKGLYIWGDVGRGKSMMMDMFFDALPNKRKRRAHFNDFMTDAQDRIHAHRKAYEAGETKEEDPIPVIAKTLSQDAAVLCFDEFTVTDIADAMILGRLFEAMFAEGVTVVATSNVEPQNLYLNGLNRKIFMRFIDLLVENIEVFELSAKTDYRLEKLDQAPVYYQPLNKASRQAMQDTWLRLTGGQKGEPESLTIKGRELIVPNSASGVALVSFDLLCQESRSALDYLALARRFHTIMIENIPIMHAEHHNIAKRFILLVDTLYDNHVRIVISAQAKPEKLYQAKSGTEAFEFERTISRLHEMESREYIGAAEVPNKTK